MPDSIFSSNFEPSSNTRQTWLGTRKGGYTCGNQEFPGFYETSGISKDWGWVSLALVVEVVAILLTIFGGYTKGGSLLFGAVIAAVLFIVLDYVGVLFHHDKVEEKTRWKNEFLISESDRHPIISAKLKRKYGKEILGVILIVFSALLKVFAIYVLMGTVLTEIIIMILSIFYLLVIYIHLYHTGFVVWEVKTNIKAKKDALKYSESHDKYRKGQISEDQIVNKAIVRSTPFYPTKISLNNIGINRDIIVGEHKIVFEKEENGTFYYSITTKGILLDSQIKLFCSGQNAEQARYIGLECLNHQFNNH